MGLVITGLDVEWRWVGVLNSVLVGTILFYHLLRILSNA
jgi:hypothetical protein